MKRGGHKYIVLAALIVSLVLLSIAGACAAGVSEADYNALKTELQMTKAELETLKAQSGSNTTIATYAEINDRCIDVWRVLSGEPSKYGYGKGDVGKWATDMQAKVASVDDAGLMTLWKAFMASTPGADQTKKGVALMGYVSDKLKTMTAK